MGEMRNAYTILVEKTEEKRRLERPRNRREDNMKKDLRERVCQGVCNWLRVETFRSSC
jgi:hypothetical protein